MILTLVDRPEILLCAEKIPKGPVQMRMLEFKSGRLQCSRDGSLTGQQHMGPFAQGKFECQCRDSHHGRPANGFSECLS